MAIDCTGSRIYRAQGFEVTVSGFELSFKAASGHLCLGEFLYAVLPSWFIVSKAASIIQQTLSQFCRRARPKPKYSRLGNYQYQI